MQDTRILTLLHFNDVYNIEEDGRLGGGAARFAGLRNKYKDTNPLLVFSGDAFFPSMMSTVLKGWQMVPVLNALAIDVALIGNHEFDMGLDHLASLLHKTTCPWLMANVREKSTHRPLCNARETLIINHAPSGMRIGFLGVVEEDWIATLSAIDPNQIEYEDFVGCATRLATELRAQGCDLVVALTHNRMANDYLLADQAKGIDIILGGHDHHVEGGVRNGVLVLNSGTDFQTLSVVTIRMPPNTTDTTTTTTTTRPMITYEHVAVNAETAPLDMDVAAIVNDFRRQVGARMDQVVGYTHVDLEARFSEIRTKETNLGNLICDALRYYLRADVVLLNAGSIRADRILPAGPLTQRDLLALLPMADDSCVIEISGATLAAALENAVSQFPKFEGRFAQVAGVRFSFDASKPAGQRVDPRLVRVLRFAARGGDDMAMQGDEQWEDLALDASYRIGTKSYMALGKDGYDCLKGSRVVVDEECALSLPMVLVNLFRTLRVLNRLAGVKEGGGEGGVGGVGRKWLGKVRGKREEGKEEVDEEEGEKKEGEKKEGEEEEVGVSHERHDARRALHSKMIGNNFHFDKKKRRYEINPSLEGRITNLTPPS